MDDRLDQDERNLDRAIDASRRGRTGVDAGELGDTIGRLHGFSLSGPQLEETRVKRTIEGGVDRTPQARPWWSPRWPQPRSLGTVGRKFATGVAVASVALGVGVASLLSTSSSASAAFLENVQTLSEVTELATADGVLDPDESNAIALLIDQLRTEAGDGALADLDDDDLARAAVLLATVDELLEDIDAENDGIEAITEAVVATLDNRHDDNDGELVGDHHDEDEDDEDIDDDNLTQPSLTDEEIQVAADALVQLEADIDLLKVEADNALHQMLAGFDDLETAVAAAEAEALALIADLPDLSEDEADEHGDDDGDEADGEHSDDDGDEVDREHGDADDEHDADDLRHGIFDDLEGELDQLTDNLDEALEDIEHQAEAALVPFDDEFRHARDDADALIEDLHDYLDSLKAEAKLAEAELKTLIKEARTSVKLALEALEAHELDEEDDERDEEHDEDDEDGDNEDEANEDDDHDDDEEDD